MQIHEILNPVLKRLRRERMRRFAEVFGVGAQTRILDVGGTTLNWQLLPEMPDVTLLNLDVELVGEGRERFRLVVGDGCRLPFRDGSFDIVFCNSLIEHLPLDGQYELAAEVRRVGRSHFVQTPNYWFPVEPHFWAPFFHWLPLALRRRTVRWITPWGLLAKPGRAEAIAAVDEMRLLSPAELRARFPGDELIVERAAFLPKSLIAVSRPDGRGATVPGPPLRDPARP